MARFNKEMRFSNLILIIARESGRRNVSKQNLRLVNGKPLLYYVLKTSLEIKNAYTVISTDSEDIKQIGEFYGVPVLDRPKKLTYDNTKLEEIATDVLERLEKDGLKFKKCLILHPHFPLIKKETIKKFFSELNDNVSSLHGFEKESDEIFGHIDKKSRLIQLSKKIVKVKKIVSFNCKKLLEKDLNQTYGLGISTEEIFSPNTYHDFAALESVMKRKRIIVKVEADTSIGLGHVYNMLTVLNEIRNEDILVLMKKNRSLGLTKFKEHLYNVKLYSNDNEFWNILDDFKPDIIFNDVLNTSASYVRKLKSMDIFIVNFEDLGQGRKFADLVFNPIFQSKEKMNHECYGSEYACVREEFRIFQKKGIRKKISKIAITLGGVDKNNNTLKIIKIIKKFRLLENIEIEIILGLGFQHKKKLFSVIKDMNSCNYKINVIEKVDLLSKYLVDCDFVITSNGRTVFEVGSLNIPIISIAVNKREQQHDFVRKFHTGNYLEITDNFENELKNSINNMMNFSVRKRKIKNLQKIDLKKGIERVISKILSKYETRKSI